MNLLCCGHGAQGNSPAINPPIKNKWFVFDWVRLIGLLFLRRARRVVCGGPLSLWVNENWWNQFKCSAQKRKQTNQSNSARLLLLFSPFDWTKRKSNWEKRRREGRASQTTNKRKREAALKLFLLVGYGRWPSCSAPTHPNWFITHSSIVVVVLARSARRRLAHALQQPQKRGHPTLTLLLVCEWRAKNIITLFDEWNK